jgi:beta-lactamase class A
MSWAWGVAPALAADAQEKEGVMFARLRARVQQIEQGLDGVLGLSVKDLKTGTMAVELRPDERFPLASTIKLAVLYELYRQKDEGRIDLAEVTRPPVPRVRGGGILQELGPAVSLTWRDLAVLMMGWSDNEATNVLIDKVGMDAVNRRLDALGLTGVRLRRRMMDLEAARRGDENVGTPSQMRQLAEVVAAGKGLSSASAKDMRAVAMVPKDNPFRQVLPEGTPLVDKHGELEGVRCLSAVVDLPGRPFSVSVNTTFLKKDADGDEAIRQVALVLYETFDRLSRASDLGRIISER